MVLGNNEYKISEDGGSITLAKDTLEKWRDHYRNVSNEKKLETIQEIYYTGKEAVLIDILKMFDSLEG